MYQTYADSFRLLLKKGMTHLEALREFDRDKIHAAVRSELGTEGPGALLDFLVSACREECNEKDMDQAIELWLAGWTSDPGTPPRDVCSWYWRAPAKKGRKAGRFYPSTNQAWRALQRAIT